MRNGFSRTGCAFAHTVVMEIYSNTTEEKRQCRTPAGAFVSSLAMNGRGSPRKVFDENEGGCLPRISFKYRPLLDLLRGSEGSSWAHRSNRVHILRDDGACAASALYHCSLLAERHATRDQARNSTGN